MASIIASIALFGAAATASSLSVGSAKVINSCSYEVYLCDVPASGGGYTEQDKTLAPGESWSQQYTQLSNGDGWSIKLSPTTSLESILQYEYTFHDDGTIWYDLSCVNGDPWINNWVLTGDNGCTPRQAAYMYPTDDDYGMQACTQDASVTVTLCSSDSSTGNGTSGSAGSSSAAPSSTAAASSYSAPSSSASSSEAPASYAAPSTSATSSTATAYSAPFFEIPSSSGSASKPVATTPTTFATSTTALVTEAPGVTVWEVDTAVVTNVVTEYAGRVKPRHAHHAHQHHA